MTLYLLQPLENSCIYAVTIKALRSTGSILGTKATGFIIDNIEGVDINEPIDLIYAEAIMKYNNKGLQTIV